MTETIINLETVNPIEFFGVNNGKLDLLKKKFPLLKILSRGTQIKLSGAPEQIESAKEKIEDEMIQSIRLKSLQAAVFIQVLFILGFSLFDEWRAEGLVNLPMPAILVGIIFVGIYLFVFYYQLYFKNNEE